MRKLIRDSIKRFCTVMLLVLSLLVSLAGCSSSKDKASVDKGTTGNQQSSDESNDQQDTTNEQDTSGDNSSTDEVTINTEYGDDGSILVTMTNGAGRTVGTVEYDASSNVTIAYVYEYNSRGQLAVEYDYEGEGNLVDQFQAGNYENATSMGENRYDAHGDYNVDLANAFTVTIDELAPLYQQAENIWDKYGVAVLIADKVSDYTSGAEQCHDYTMLERSIKLIESCLQCYPTGFFKEFSESDVNTTVCIQVVGTGSSAGLYIDGYEFEIIQIDVNDYYPEDGYDDKGNFFCYTLHHEICHMISQKLLERADWSSCPLTEEEWNSYNPAGFQYVGYYDDELESELYCAGDNNEYFIYSYSCSTASEDRSIIFGNAMNYYQGYDRTIFSEHIEAKLQYLSDCIRAAFDSADWPETLPWEKILE